MLRTCLLATVICAACPACGDDGNHATDAPTGDGQCAGEDFFTGAVVDWDSTESAFCGVFQATFTVVGDESNTSSTNPNGRFQLCLPNTAMTQVDVTPPTATSECAPIAGIYQLPGIAMATHAVIASGANIEWRMIGMDRVMPFFSNLGITFDNTKAIVFVHVEGTASAVTSSAAHDAALAFDGTTWAAGDTGQDVVFPNSDPTAGTATVGFASGTGIGGGTFPIAAHTFTYVTLVGS